MTARYEVTVNQEQLRDAIRLFEFVGGNTSNAMRVAINKAGPKIKTLASEKIREQVNLQAKYVGDRLKFVRATTNSLNGRITTPSRGILLSRFSTNADIRGDKFSLIKAPKVGPRGIRIKVKPNASPKRFDGDPKPFYMILKNSRAIGIVSRERGSRKIKVFHGPSLSQVFNDVRNDVQPEANDELTKQLIDAMRYVLSRRYPSE